MAALNIALNLVEIEYYKPSSKNSLFWEKLALESFAGLPSHEDIFRPAQPS